MSKRRRRLRLGIVMASGGLLLCCLLPYVALDPLLNVALFGGIAPPVIPEYPHGQQIRRRVEREGLRTHRSTTFQTSDTQPAVIDFYARNLGPQNGKWRRNTMAHYPPRPEIAQTWEYKDYCPDTLLDLTFTPLADGLTDVEMTVTQSSCRDAMVVVILINLCPPCSRYLPE